jgi:NAD(P)-dependent dehydrogenase (short-subunit alcohol dehydrogenase family)
MNIIVTGAARGIGFETVVELAKDPQNRIIAISRNVGKLNELYKNVDFHSADITTITKSEMDAILQPYGNIDILINNAGSLVNKKFDDLMIEDWRNIFEVNLFGTVNITRFVLPYLKKRPVSHIVNIGSMGGVSGTSKFEGLSAYSASKAAIANLTECLAEELKAFNVRVNCLALGAVNTEMLQDAFPDYVAPVNANEMGKFIADFSLRSHNLFNGKVIPVSVSTP